MGSAARNIETPLPPSLRAVPPLAPDSQVKYLLGSRADFWLMGGVSLALLVLCHVFLKHESLSPGNALFIYNLSFLINFPHFLSSYHMLYGDFSHRILHDRKFFWAALVAPLILLGLFAEGIFAQNIWHLGHLANAMFFFVGWHYGKQIFGTVIVSNALAGYYFSKLERNALRINLGFVWMVSWSRFAVGNTNYSFQGFPYHAIGLPLWVPSLMLAGAGISALAVLGFALHRYIADGQKPALGAAASWVTFHAWYIPAFGHPAFALLIPLFHSLQYLVFVGAFRRAKAAAGSAELSPPHARARYLSGTLGQYILAGVTGALLMWFLPRELDKLNLVSFSPRQPALFFGCFTIFINIHHYFIDNVLWRSSNPEMRDYLFKQA